MPRKMVEKREFIQYASKYLKWVEEKQEELVITHQNKPDFILRKKGIKSFADLRGIAKIKIHGDVNAPVLPSLID